MKVFADVEWRVLEKAARKNQQLMAEAAALYADHDGDGQIEEATANMFAEWKAWQLAILCRRLLTKTCPPWERLPHGH